MRPANLGPLISLNLEWVGEDTGSMQAQMDRFGDDDDVTLEWSDFKMTAKKAKWVELGIFT